MRRILGPLISEEDCQWALEATEGDAAHAVKLLRLRTLLPESMIQPSNLPAVLSALDMSHWDVARTSAFLLANSSRHCSGVKLAPVPAPRPSKANLINANVSSSGNEGDSCSELRPTHV